MANEEHLTILKQGVEVWNKWREKNIEIIPNLSQAIFWEMPIRIIELRGIDFRRANLSGADLRGTDLTRVNLSGANLDGAKLASVRISQETVLDEKWRKVWEIVNQSSSNKNLKISDLRAADLSETNLSGADLRGANLREANLFKTNLDFANLSEADLSSVNLTQASLKNINFKGAKLRKTNLSGQDLNKQDLSETDLTGANLSRVQALATNFQGATLTGACIEDWNINRETNLDDVICEYVYLKENLQERRPHDLNNIFTPGEFIKLFQKALATVDLIFKDGIDWQAFLISFQKLQEEQKLKIESGDKELPVIRAIENKDDGTFVIRVSVPFNLDKAEVEKYLKREYECQLKAIENKYRWQLNAKDEQIEIYKQNSANIIEMARLIAKVGNPTIVNVEAKAVAEGQSQGDTITQTGSFGIGINKGEVEAEKLSGTINEAQSKSLAQTATEIQELLKQLEQSYPTHTTAEQMAVAAEAIERIESNPTWKQRVVNAAKEAGLAAFEKAIDNPIGALIVGAIKGWLEAEAK